MAKEMAAKDGNDNITPQAILEMPESEQLGLFINFSGYMIQAILNYLDQHDSQNQNVSGNNGAPEAGGVSPQAGAAGEDRADING